MGGTGHRGGRWRPAAVAAAGLALGVAAVAPARAQDAPGSAEEVRETPAVLQADEVQYEDQRDVVVARGSVEIAQGERILLADKVTYNLETDIITAEGNVSLLQPTGEVLFGDYVEVTGDLREGAMRAFRMLFTDNSRLAAASAVRVDDNRTDMENAVYSPCDLCREDPSSAPLWQLRATRVTHDQAAQKVRYRNARWELFGIPLFYTPYLEHPDPTAERQTGLLPITPGYSSDLGATARIPYYIVLSDQADLTLSPLFTSDAGQVAQGTYTRRTGAGEFKVTASLTQARGLEQSSLDNVRLRRRDPTVEEGDLRWHVDAEGEFEIDDNWRWSFGLNRVSDDAYLQRYDLGFRDPLESDLTLERFEGENYFAAQALSYQGLRRRDDEPQEPFVLPDARYFFTSDPDYQGGRLFGQLGTLNLMRSEGRDTQRLSGTLGWERSWRDPVGGEVTFTSVVNADAYTFQDTIDGTDTIDPIGQDGETGSAGRVFPQAALRYEYPFVRHSQFGTEVLTPIAQLVVGPNGGNDLDIPNEDSRTFEFGAGNLFALDRLPGRDRVSSGQRIDYGIRYTYTTPEGGGTADALFGQSYRISTDDVLPETVGLDNSRSDYVGRLSLSPFRYLTTAYDFRMDEETLDIGRSDYSLFVGPPAFNVFARYTQITDDEETFNDFRDREQINVGLRSRFSRYWSVLASHRRDLQRDAGLSTTLGIGYSDECFRINLRAERQFYPRSDLDPDTSVLLTISLKNLGEFGNN
jgi:LPS-assembly protein